MKGVLVVAHGSRAKETEITLETVLETAKSKISDSDTCIEHAFMEFSDKTIEKGIVQLIEKGVSEIKVVPYFLFSGIHLKEDIPNTVSECMGRYPNIKFVMGETLGTDERLADILVDRIRL